ncbi:MAG TPA: protein-disulfide reductase DsbD domain-containing protein [Terriglobia bacterium]|nr:protein-disulfide reductase DsbD domain-containing protein [Terriglobia bacterium]
MNPIRRIFWSCTLACWTVTGMAAVKTPPVVEASAVLETDAAHSGSTVQAALVAKIASGYHINDHKPSHDYLIPSELKLDPNPQVAVQEINYPPGTPIKFEFDDAKLSVYEGTLIIRAGLKIAAGTKPGDYTLKGKFAYQACNDRACFPPTSVPVQLVVKVVGASVPLKRVHEDLFKRVKVE